MQSRRGTITVIALLLFLLTIVLDVIPIDIRYWIGSFLSSVLVSAVVPDSAQAFPSYAVGLFLAFAPVMWAIVVLPGLPSGSFLTRFELKARRPTTQELEIIEPVLVELASIRPDICRPHALFVSNIIDPPALAIGRTLYINADLLHEDQQYLAPALAHELGHLNTLDSHLVEALRRLRFPGVALLVRALNSLNMGAFEAPVPARGMGTGTGVVVVLDIALMLFAGGFGLRILSPIWRMYFHTCEYAADRYAVSLGQKETLAAMVDNLEEPLDVPFDWMWKRAGTAGYMTKRLELLRHQLPGSMNPSESVSPE